MPSSYKFAMVSTTGRYHVHVAMVKTTGHSKMAAASVNTCAPKAVSKILNDTADGENICTNERNY